MGRSTCASASALNLDAQPEQLDNVVSRIFFSDGVSVLFIVFTAHDNHEARPGQGHASRNSFHALPAMDSYQYTELSA
jgi:hypothetical protein